MSQGLTKLPRMQNQARRREGPEERAGELQNDFNKISQGTEDKQKYKPVMRQYDLIEWVRSYNPNTNEALLDRAYVYAMKAHGSQTRASGDPFFSTRSNWPRSSPTLTR